MVRTDLLRFAFKRIILFVPVWLGISLISFSIIHLAPGSPVTALLPEGARSPENIARVRAKWGLDEPFHIQYLKWLTDAAQGDLGYAFGSGAPVTSVIADAIVPTAQLAFVTLVLAVAFALPLGILAGVYEGTWVDQLSRLIAFGGVSMPNFWIGIMLILIFGQYWGGWFGSGLIPTGGYASLTEDGFVQWFKHIFPPAFSIAVGFTGITMRITRGAMIEELNKQYVKTARSKGLKAQTVTVVHVLRNALIPVVTVVGIQIGQVMNGVIVIEEVFSVPGMGRLLFWSAVNQDIPVITAMLLVIGTIYLFSSLTVDILYAYLDPRIRYD